MGENLSFLNNLKTEEVLNSRLELLKLVQEELIEENQITNEDYRNLMLNCVYGPNIELNIQNLSVFTESLGENLDKKVFELIIHYPVDKTTKIMPVETFQKPEEIIRNFSLYVWGKKVILTNLLINLLFVFVGFRILFMEINIQLVLIK